MAESSPKVVISNNHWYYYFTVYLSHRMTFLKSVVVLHLPGSWRNLIVTLRNEFAVNVYGLRFSKALPPALSELLVSTKWGGLPWSIVQWCGYPCMTTNHQQVWLFDRVWPFEFKAAYWDTSHNQLERTTAPRPEFWIFCAKCQTSEPLRNWLVTSRWMWSWRFQEWLPLTSEARPDCEKMKICFLRYLWKQL